jgi:Glycosyltransferase family 87
VTSSQSQWHKAAAPSLRRWWARHGESLLRAAIAVMGIAALVWLGYQFWRLLWGEAPIWPTSPPGAIDLKLMHRLVHDWFAGRRIYGELGSAVYPPATYVLLWPLVGWLDIGAARLLWGLTTVIALGAIIHLLVRESGAVGPLERAFVALLPCSIYATGAAIGNGQLIVHLLPMLLAAILLLRREPRGWREALVASGLIVAAMAKPQIAAPFLWLVLFLPRSLRPALLVGIGYGLLTLFALYFPEATLGEMIHAMRSRSAAFAVTSGHGNASNLHVWLGMLGLQEWIFPASLLVWLGLGFWILHHRDADIWVLLGVAAIVACFWTYHRWYDDVLLLLPMVALFRIAKQGSAAAGVLLGAAVLLTLAPGGLFLLPPTLTTAYVFGQTVLWIATLIFLHRQARTQRSVLRRPPDSSPPASAAPARPP